MPIGLASPVLLLRAHEDQLVSPFCKPCQGIAGGIGDLLGGRLHGSRKSCQHPRIDRISLGELAAGTCEVARPGRVDPGKADSGLAQHLAKFEVIDARGLEDDQHIASPTRRDLCDGLRRVGDALRKGQAFIEDIEILFGDVDSDATKGYDHDACPCDARSVGAASCNCSGW